MRKIEEIMPLDIPRYLADTADLDNATSGAYLHALMHQWLRGPLPNDMVQCANIMKIRTLGAPDIARAILTTFFSQLENATWIQKRGAAMKADVTAKAIRYNARAVRANEVRWRGHIPKYPRRDPSRTPTRNPQGIHMESFGSPMGIPVVLDLEVQDQNGDSFHSSPGGQPQAAVLHSGGEKHLENGSKPNGHVKGSPARPKKAQDAPQAAQTAKSVTQGEKRAATRQSSRKTTLKNEPETVKKPARVPDPRFVPFRREVRTFWSKQNPGGLRYAWNEADGRALNNLLRRYRSMQLDRFKELLRNRAQSDVNPAEAPEDWLARLGEFGVGPLDRYKRLK